MNSLQDLIKRLSNIGQVTEAEEKCSECGCTPCECDDKEEKVDEGAMDKLKALGKKALDTLGHKDDEELIKDMQKQQGLPQTGKKPEPVKEEEGSFNDDGSYNTSDDEANDFDEYEADEEEKSMKESALNLLRKYAGIQEAKIEEDEVEEGNEFSGALKAAKDAGKDEFEVGGKKYKVTECGDMAMSPMSAVSDMASPIQVMGNPEAEPEMSQMAEPEASKPKYTLSIQNGENNLSMTTDVPDEIIHIMKLAGVNKGAEVSKKEMSAAGEQEVEESGYENTPDNTQARDPQAFGDIRDWGKKGTGAGKPAYPGTRASGDNPMSEQQMFEDYKNFKAGK